MSAPVLGAQWQAANRWSLRRDYERFEDVGVSNRTGEADIDWWSLGVLFRL